MAHPDIIGTALINSPLMKFTSVDKDLDFEVVVKGEVIIMHLEGLNENL